MNNLGVSLVIGVGAVMAINGHVTIGVIASVRYVYTPIFPSD